LYCFFASKLGKLNQENICVLGLGYVGLTLAVSLANADYQVHGLEVRKDVLDQLTLGNPTFFEEGLESEIKSALKKQRFTFSQTLQGLPFKPSVYIITVGTPLGADDKIRLDMIENATREIAATMADGDLVILRSTVRLGTARKIISPILDQTGFKYQIAVCPERTLEGSALKELHYLPQIIGSDDLETRERCAVLFGRLTPTTIKVSTLETAELIKLVDNTYRDVIFSFGNEVARICDAAGINAYEVINGGKLGYPRTNVALPGLVGGPCLEKDPHILNQSAKLYGLNELEVTKSARLVNERQPVETVDFIVEAYQKKNNSIPQNILIAGLTFKGYPETDDLRGSMALDIIAELKQRYPQAKFSGFDPQLNQKSIEGLGLQYESSLTEAASRNTLIVITNNHPIFKKAPWPQIFDQNSTSLLVYDYWNSFNAFDREAYKDRYIVLGNHTAFLRQI
jgi:UDP-N-acetyl-D-mannosaminuronic acid dehydrogenase